MNLISQPIESSAGNRDAGGVNNGKEETPNNPEKNIPTKPDINPDPTKPKPGGNEPNKNDPMRIEEPSKNDPTRIPPGSTESRGRKWTKVYSWYEVPEKSSREWPPARWQDT